MSYQVQHPIILFAFNRVNTTREVLLKIRTFQPKKLYFVCDGARDNNVFDKENCPAVLALLDEVVDWDCEIIKNISKHNLGCGKRISSGLDWGFSLEEKLIVLEDDIVPSENFFRFCDHYLDLLSHDETTLMISGCNLVSKNLDDQIPEVYKSKFGGIWGWASWSRAWKSYRFDCTRADVKSLDFISPEERTLWEYFLSLVLRGKLNTWDYQWDISRFMAKGHVLSSKFNLTKNIGFGELSTHTNEESSIVQSSELYEGELSLPIPQEIQISSKADQIYYQELVQPSWINMFKIKLKLFLWP